MPILHILPNATRNRSAMLAGLMLAPWLLLPLPAPGATVEGVEFAETARAGEADLALQGAGLLRYRVLFRAYVAALYLPPEVDPTRALEDVPKRLVIEYFWPIAAEDFGPAGEQILARNVPPERLDALRSRLDAIDALYRDVEPGDRYALTYVPGEGTELAKNGESLGVIPGADFARAYFSIWLGDEPLDEGLRDALLSQGD